MANKSQAIRHKNDIKLICPIRNLGSAVTVYGFETYQRVTDAKGTPVKQLIPNVPAQFEPGNMVEDGFSTCFVSDTEHNRKLIRELMAANVVGCDHAMFEATPAPAVEKLAVEPLGSDQFEHARLMGMTKAQLMEMALGMGVKVGMTLSKSEIIALMTKTPAE